MSDFDPHLPDDSHVGVTCPHCGEHLTYPAEQRPAKGETGKGTCSHCDGEFYVFNDGTAWKPLTWWKKAGIYLAIAFGFFIGFIPALMIDGKVHEKLNVASGWLQENLAVSKYWLALCTTVLGLGVLFLGDLFNGFIWVYIIHTVIGWLYKKARDDSQDSGEVLRLEDQQVVDRATRERVATKALAMFFGVLGIIAHDGDYDWVVASLGFVIMSVGLHWVSASYVPPWKRKVFDFFQDLVSQTGRG